MTGTVAPARHPLTVLHKQARLTVAPEPHPDTGEAVGGWTACGTAMLLSELWQPVEWRPGDRLCPGCFPGEPAPPGWVQEAMM